MIILRQKQYSPGFSGIKQVLKKNIDKVRMKLADKIDASIEQDLINKINAENKGWKLSNELHEIPETTNLAELEINQIEPIEKIKVIRSSGNPELDIKNKRLTLPDPVSLGEVKHEIGHLKNSRGENGVRAKRIYEQGQSERNLRELGMIDYLSESPNVGKREIRDLELRNASPETVEKVDEFFNSAKLLDAYDRFRRGRILLQDEKNATKWAINDIKNQLSPEVLKLEKERQGAGNNSYKHSILASSKIPIRNKIQIPSKRGDFNFKRLNGDD